MTDRVIVGAAPGQREVVQGKPFVGASGQRLDEALRPANVDRPAFYITNTVLCHPEGNKAPEDDAVQACHDRFITEIRLRMPSKVLALGKTAIHELTPERGTIEELRGKRVPSPELEDYTELRVTYHPSPLALNTNPARSAQFDEDVAWVGEP